MALVYVQEDGGGDYTTLAAAISASETEIEIQETWTSAETSNYTIASATTIVATGSARHSGFVGSSPTHWRAKPTSSGNHTFLLNADLTVEGMDISNQSTGVSDEVFRLNADNVDLIGKFCLLWLGARIDQQDIAYNDSKSSCSVLFENCIGWNAYRAVIDQYNGGNSTYDINSSHFYNCGFSSDESSRSGVFGLNMTGGTVNCSCFNSLLNINTGNVATTTAGVTSSITIDRCITNVADYTSANWDTETITDSLLSHNWTDDDTKASDGDWVIVEDITTAPYDFRLAINDYNEAQDAHADGSGAGLTMPSTDIVGTSRPQNTNYDIGAFEIVSGGEVTYLTFIPQAMEVF
jgi:hypothetical protein